MAANLLGFQSEWTGNQEGPTTANGCDHLAHLMKPLREMISAWQSLTVSPFRLRESPFTQRFPAHQNKTGAVRVLVRQVLDSIPSLREEPIPGSTVARAYNLST